MLKKKKQSILKLTLAGAPPSKKSKQSKPKNTTYLIYICLCFVFAYQTNKAGQDFDLPRWGPGKVAVLKPGSIVVSTFMAFLQKEV